LPSNASITKARRDRLRQLAAGSLGKSWKRAIPIHALLTGATPPDNF
jgi:hypothetical protein